LKQNILKRLTENGMTHLVYVPFWFGAGAMPVLNICKKRGNKCELEK
jgi:hypothetical protein